MSQKIFDKRLKFVDSIISLAKKEKEIKQKIYLLENINYYMTNNHCGVFRYEPMEELLQEIGKEFVVDNQANTVKNSFLHIMTKASVTGGHTRVVENFIKNRKEYTEKHHVILISQNNETKPEFCKELESKNELFDLSNLDALEKIKEIALESLKYEYIILHHHMYDVLPIIALSQYKNKKNIYAYNHADHLYWVGSSILTGSFEMSMDGLNFSQSRREINNTILLPIPLEKKEKITTDLKEKLNIPNSSKIALTIGSQDRFITDEYSYKDMLQEVFSKNKDICFIIVGKHTKEYWKELWTHPNIRFVGLVPKEQLGEYYSIADIYVDSFPMGGDTATLDALCYEIPSIKVKHIFFEFDSLKPFVVEKELVADKVLEIFSNYKVNRIEKNINEHFIQFFNNTIDNLKLKKNILDTHILLNNIKVLNYDLMLFTYQDRKRSQLINGFIKKLNYTNHIKYFLNLIFSLERVIKLYLQVKNNV